MKALDFMTPKCVYLEIGQSSLKVLDGDAGLSLPLERLANGRLSGACRDACTASLRAFLKKRIWSPRNRAFCAIGARGVSLRRLTLPPTSKENLPQLLNLQVEKEFPLPPEELAWGYCQIGPEDALRNRNATGQDLIVIAVKREVIAEYSELLDGCGLNPVFTLGALAGSLLCPRLPDTYSVLDMGRSSSELITFVDGSASTVRILPWGGDDITRAIEQKLAISHDEAEKRKLNFTPTLTDPDDTAQQVQGAIRAALDSLAASIKGSRAGQKLYLTGSSAQLANLAQWLAEALGSGWDCERMAPILGSGRSAAILGLQRSDEKEGRSLPWISQAGTMRSEREGNRVARPAQWQWAALAAMLAITALTLRYAESWFKKPGLSRRLAALNTEKKRLPEIDRELNFLQHLEKNQPPYLNTLAVLAGAAAPGTRFDSLALNRRGDLSLRGTMQNAQQATDFRSKLIDSGLFSTVVVDEQTPTPDRQRIVVRINARWKPSNDVKSGTPAKRATPPSPAPKSPPVRTTSKE